MRQPKILTTLKTYSWQLFVSDLLAGVTVAMVALPLSLAIAIASGADPAKGIVTAIVGGFLISLFGGSRVQIGGPTGAFIVVVFSVIAQYGYDGLVLATFMAGIILLVGGYFRAGNLIAFVPEAVVNGFTIGIGIIIATSQLKDFLGLVVDKDPADFLEKIPVLWEARDTFSPATFIIAIVTLILIVVLRRIAPRFPGLIVAVGLGSALVALMSLPVDTLGSRFGELPSSMPWPQLPDLSPSRMIELLPSAFIIAFLAGVESLLSAMVYEMPALRGEAIGVNYGFEKVRFLSPVPTGSEVRGRFTLAELAARADGGFMLTYDVTVEIKGQTKPALAARWLGLRYLDEVTDV